MADLSALTGALNVELHPNDVLELADASEWREEITSTDIDIIKSDLQYRRGGPWHDIGRQRWRLRTKRTMEPRQTAAALRYMWEMGFVEFGRINGKECVRLLKPSVHLTPGHVGAPEKSSGSPSGGVSALVRKLPSGFLGGTELAKALGIHATRRKAFFRQLERRRVNLGDDCWQEVQNVRPNSPQFLYRVDSPKLRELAVRYTRPKPT